jgi:ParB family chromosome partitioning protein
VNRLKLVATDLIDDPHKPIRSFTDEKSMADLKASIAEVGIIEPLVVFEKPIAPGSTGFRYEVIAGHRRLMAAQQIAMREVPCVVYKTEPEALQAIQLHENIHREDLNPADEARWFLQLLPLCGDDTDSLAAKVHASRAYVEGRLNLLRGDPIVLEALGASKISYAVADELNKFQQDWYRRDCLNHAIEGGASARLVRMWRSKETAPAAAPAESAPDSSQVSATTPALPATVFECLYCGLQEHVYDMELVYIHRPCKTILERFLRSLEKPT